MKNLLCTLFGHNYYQGTLTLALNLMPEGGSWQKIAHTSETTICRRCKDTPVIGAVLIGTIDTHIQYSPSYSIDATRVFLDREAISEISPQDRPPQPEGEMLGDKDVYGPPRIVIDPLS